MSIDIQAAVERLRSAADRDHTDRYLGDSAPVTSSDINMVLDAHAAELGKLVELLRAADELFEGQEDCSQIGSDAWVWLKQTKEALKPYAAKTAEKETQNE